MKTTEADWRGAHLKSEPMRHAGKLARGFSATYYILETDEDINDLGRQIAEWSFEISSGTVEKNKFLDCMLKWACCLPNDRPAIYSGVCCPHNGNPAIYSVLFLAFEEIYESYTKWMDMFRNGYSVEDNDEEDEDY